MSMIEGFPPDMIGGKASYFRTTVSWERMWDIIAHDTHIDEIGVIYTTLTGIMFGCLRHGYGKPDIYYYKVCKEGCNVMDSSNLRKLYDVGNDAMCSFIKNYLRSGYLNYRSDMVRDEDKAWFMSTVLGSDSE